MSGGLLALLDDVAAIAKIAAASLDDAAGQAMKASSKAAGIIIDDAAVTPRYVVGFAAERELPIVARIAWGSLKNKMLYLLPAALLMSAFTPWAIEPLLMLGGLYLCFEGYEKVAEWLGAAPPTETTIEAKTPESARLLEDQRVAGAIRTDLILSAEIMAISLASVAGASILSQGLSLAVVALFITGLVYGVVALIVKADDFGFALTKRDDASSQALGRALVNGMPTVLKVLSIVGTLAMLWVGGGIVLHGLAHYGLSAPEHAINGFAKFFSALPAIGGLVGWLISAACAGVVGLILGWPVAKVAGKYLH